MIGKNKGVGFWASKPYKNTVSFRNKEGKRVSFTAIEGVPKKVKARFWASTKGKKIKKRKAVIDPGDIIVLLLLILLVLYLRAAGIINCSRT